MIPAEAIEAGWIAYLASERDGLERIRTILEAAAPHMIASPVFTERMVDAVLDHSGTPRRKLFEYPYRDDDSRDIIKRAEMLVWRILTLATEGEK